MIENTENIYIHKKVDRIGGRFNVFHGWSNLTIHAPAGSYAEKYAKEWNIPFVAE
jgi:hypothetical protein